MCLPHPRFYRSARAIELSKEAERSEGRWAAAHHTRGAHSAGRHVTLTSIVVAGRGSNDKAPNLPTMQFVTLPGMVLGFADSTFLSEPEAVMWTLNSTTPDAVGALSRPAS